MYSVIFLIENTNVGHQVEKAANVSLHTRAHASQRTRTRSQIIELKKQLEAPVHFYIVFENLNYPTGSALWLINIIVYIYVRFRLFWNIWNAQNNIWL